ncbi:MAG: hypothetical protein AB1758_15090 [Candidatus Eremiobacterota bacterium]
MALDIANRSFAQPQAAAGRAEKGYMVERHDDGPGGGKYYVRVDRPEPGEVICRGMFAPYQVDEGPYGSSTRYRPVGRFRTEVFGEEDGSAGGYFVRRASDGPYAGYYYVKVDQPEPGDVVCHGKFRPYEVDNGPYGSDTRYSPVGRVRTEIWGTEEF